MYKDYRKEPFAVQSRGLRNNNPMNLRPFKILYNGQVGTDKDGHAIFENIIMGLRAGAMELKVNYKKGLNTLTKTIADFAPPNENNTNQYINYVSQQTGLAPNYVFTLNGQNVAKIMAAMIVQEIGSKYAKYITADEIREGINALKDDQLNISLDKHNVIFLTITMLLLGAVVMNKDKLVLIKNR